MLRVRQVTADPTVQFYLRAQGIAVLGFGAMIGLCCVTIALFSEGELSAGTLPILVIGLGFVGVSVRASFRGFRAEAPPLSLDEDGTFRVGDSALKLDASTELIHRGRAVELELPEPRKRGFAAMPNGLEFPPHFSGGPTIIVKTAAGEVSFRPILYGPAAYINSGLPAASDLMQRLASYGDGGDARAWIAQAFAQIEGQPKPPPSFKIFMIIFLCVAIPVLGLLLTSVVIGIIERISG